LSGISINEMPAATRTSHTTLKMLTAASRGTGVVLPVLPRQVGICRHESQRLAVLAAGSRSVKDSL
jgi:hypothetical protein